MKQRDLINPLRGVHNKPNDVWKTPATLVKKMIEICKLKDHEIVLDPCREEGAFYNQLREPKRWCEITQDVDFLTFREPVDCIIGNPPFSQWDVWLRHTISLEPSRFCYIFGTLNLTPNRIRMARDHGYHLVHLAFVYIHGYFGHSFVALFSKTPTIPIIEYLPRMKQRE